MSNVKAPLQDGIDYKSEIIAQICAAQPVIALLLDDPSADIDSDAAYAVTEKNIFDYDYISRTVERSDAFIMVDADMIAATSGSMNAWEVYVQIVCHKQYVALNPKRFKGIKGNRTDNLTNQIDLLLNGKRFFGIGRLVLQSCKTAVVPDDFTSKLLTYRVEEFRRERQQ